MVIRGNSEVSRVLRTGDSASERIIGDYDRFNSCSEHRILSEFLRVIVD